MSDLSYTVSGELFHTRGPATAKLLSPRVVRMRGTASVLYEDERRRVAGHAVQKRLNDREPIIISLIPIEWENARKTTGILIPLLK